MVRVDVTEINPSLSVTAGSVLTLILSPSSDPWGPGEGGCRHSSSSAGEGDHVSLNLHHHHVSKRNSHTHWV